MIISNACPPTNNFWGCRCCWVHIMWLQIQKVGTFYGAFHEAWNCTRYVKECRFLSFFMSAQVDHKNTRRWAGWGETAGLPDMRAVRDLTVNGECLRDTEHHHQPAILHQCMSLNKPLDDCWLISLIPLEQTHFRHQRSSWKRGYQQDVKCISGNYTIWCSEVTGGKSNEKLGVKSELPKTVHTYSL